MLNKLVFVDLETTGGRVNYDRIIEVGIVRVEHGEIVDTYQTLINPETYLSPFIENMTGIYHEDLESAPTFSEVKDEILERLGDCVFVAHNVRFDYGFLRNEFRRFDISYSAKHFCTAKLSKLLYPQHRHHNLDAIIERFGFACENRHRAFDDAKVLWDFYQAVSKEFGADAFTKMLDMALKKPSIPTQLSSTIFDNLPESPGVYIFYGAEDAPLYIGKSVNIRERVLSHFSSDYESSREMSICSQTTRIETIETSGELGALLLESSLIKKMQPLYNRRLRLAQRLVLLRLKKNSQGYETVQMEETHGVQPTDLEEIVGIFKSRRQAKEFLRSVAKEHQLCEKLLGVEKSYSSCFGHKLGVCRGACLGKELPVAYNMRIAAAFAHNKVKTWPYKGPVIIKEGVQEKTSYVVDKWCLLGSVNDENEAPVIGEYAFDMDTYNILSRYLKSQKNAQAVHVLTA